MIEILRTIGLLRTLVAKVIVCPNSKSKYKLWLPADSVKQLSVPYSSSTLKESANYIEKRFGKNVKGANEGFCPQTLVISLCVCILYVLKHVLEVSLFQHT